MLPLLTMVEVVLKVRMVGVAAPSIVAALLAIPGCRQTVPILLEQPASLDRRNCSATGQQLSQKTHRNQVPAL